MTPAEIQSIADRHIDAWRNTDPRTSDIYLRERVATAITEALTKKAKEYADGAATLRHERDLACHERDNALAELQQARNQ